MKQSFYFYKVLTAAEVGDTDTHEVYIRLINEFDHNSFFGGTVVKSGTVEEVNFTAQDITNGGYKSIQLRFVYYISSKNKEKRIPSLFKLYKHHDVKKGDVVCLESRQNGTTISYFICFYKKGEIQVKPEKGIFFSRIDPEFEISNNPDLKKSYLQKIFFGTPGGGKSHKVKDMLEGKENRTIRTTFHPDTDYASFVGSYKPIMDGDNILYSFRPQAFTEAYIKAWNDLANDYYLVIEEISRGNCAQIFGDLFQLLDRKKDGYSEYPIDADADLREYLDKNLTNKDGIKDGKLCLPPNLSILATMNTSDQSLFPMDSAFKRRWEWEYVPSLYEDGDDSDFTIKIGDKEIKWHAFLDKINPAIKNSTDSEDKQLGAFFIKENITDSDKFKSKVMFYLWSEICKEEYGTNNNFFRRKTADGEYKEFTFNELYSTEGDNILIDFIKYLEDLEPVSKIIKE